MPSTPHKGLISTLEVALFSTAYFLGLWILVPIIEPKTIAPLLVGVLVLAGFYGAYLSPVHIHHDSLAERGLGNWQTAFVRVDNLRVALAQYGSITLVAAVVVVGLSTAQDPEVFQRLRWESVALKFIFYLFNAWFQCLLLFSYMLLRLRDATSLILHYNLPRRKDALSVYEQTTASAMFGILFAMYHLPNVPLMALALLFGISMAWIYFRTPNLFLLAICHAALGTLLHRVAEVHMRVGPFYRNPEQFLFREAFPFFGRIIGDTF